MESSKTESTAECVTGESSSSGGYDSMDKQTLIKLVVQKDELLKEKAENISQLQQEVCSLNQLNEHLQEELKRLKSEIQQYKGKDSLPDMEFAGSPVNETTPQLNEEGGIEGEDKPMPDWTTAGLTSELSSSISDAVRATAEAEMRNIETEHQEGTAEDRETSSEYVFDASSGYYYHPSTGYYWDPNSGLFYDYTSGTYYQYNESTGDYEVHSQVDVKTDCISAEETKTHPQLGTSVIKSLNIKDQSSARKTLSKRKKTERTRRKIKKKTSAGQKGERKCAQDLQFSHAEDESSGSLATDESELVSDPESGEILSSSSSDVEIIEEEKLYERPWDSTQVLEMEQHYTDAIVENYPPCIRVIVQASQELCAGTLFIITCSGGTIGRVSSAKHSIQIPDCGISKVHAKIDYDYTNSCYNVTDLGSQNGTWVNRSRVCQEKSENNTHSLNHGDILQLGSSTKLLLHIHKGHETCEECEPGQIQAKLKAQNPLKKLYTVLTKEERKQQHRRELKTIKKRYGLENSHYENEGATLTDPKYTDKAHLRRKFVGSEIDNIKTDSSASVHSPIASSNKGHKLLSKMGWKEGQGLGKANAGIAEPINVELRVNQNAGLGSQEGTSLSLDRVQDSNKAKRWSQARQRFNKLQPSSNPSTDQDLASHQHSLSKNDGANVSNPATYSPLPVNNKNVPQPSIYSTPFSLSKKGSKSDISKPQIIWHKGETETFSNNVPDNKSC